jgi:hypothetical protein
MKEQIEKLENETYVSRDDIQRVATDIFKKDLSDEEVLKVLSNYNDAEEADPIANWGMIVEDLLYQLENLEVEA